MSHTVVRGQPNASQLHLDGILDEILRDKGILPDAKKRDKVILAEIAYHCMRKKLDGVFMINGATGEKVTNGQILRRSVSLARSIVAKGAKGKTVMVVMRNHQQLAAVYWAVLFSGVLPFLMDPNTTVYELNYFIKLIEPCFVFCDREHNDDIYKALEDIPHLKPNVVICDEDELLMQFADGHSDDLHSFQIPEASPESTIMLLPTSGSTGLPKAALITNRGLVAQLPSVWSYHTQFPTPTERVMLLTTLQWMTFTMMFTSCAVYHIPLLISPKQTTVENVTEMIEKFRPTWTFFGPAFANSLLKSISAEQLTSLNTVILLGAPATPELMAAFLAKLPKTVQLCDGYGTTETQGFVAIPDRETPINSNGRVINILYYKVVDDNGVEVKPGNNGELYLKGECTIKSYYKNVQSYNEAFIDGWYKTGDWFHLDVNERLYYIERRKFSFKFRGNQVSPEEVEAVISTVPGVHESVVCGSDDGPAAAVVLHPNCEVPREHIHKAVNSSLSDHKRLHGGIAFVKMLPHTHSGKLKRNDCKKIIQELTKSGNCF